MYRQTIQRVNATAPAPDSSRARIAFGAALLALIAFKLWLIHEEEIVGSATQFDALWYVRSASYWYWGRPYDWVAFIRPGAYPLFIALVHWLHLPLRLAIEFLQIGGALVLVGALRGLGVGRVTAALSFAAICLHPAGYQLNNYSMSDTFYAGMFWLVLGGLLWTMRAFRLWPALLTGLAIGVLWNAREEGFILIAILLVWVAICFFRTRKIPALPLLALIASAALVVLVFYSINRATYRSFARSEMTAPVFESLFHSLLRIRPAEPKRYAPITTEAITKAFEVSPAFAKLRPYLAGPMGYGWQTETFLRRGVRGEIGAGWIVWATRQSISAKGYFSDPAKAQKFFKKAAREINAACDDGRLPTRFVIDGFLDPMAQSGGLSALPSSAKKIAARFFARWSIAPMPDDKILTADETALYNHMTRRRSAGVGPREGAAFAVEHFIGRYHFVLSIGLHLAALLAAASFFIRRKARGATQIGGAILLLGSAVFFRSALFSWLDATAFDGTEDRFLFPVLPLWTVALLLTVAFALKRWRQSADVPI